MDLVWPLVPFFDPEDPTQGPCLEIGVGSKQSSRTEAFPTNGDLIRETRKGQGPPGGREAWLPPPLCHPLLSSCAVRGSEGRRESCIMGRFSELNIYNKRAR